MNDLVKAILEHEYTNQSMKKQLYIYKRTRKERIKDKAFKKLFAAFTTENPFVRIGDVVLMDYGAYRELENQLQDLVEIEKVFEQRANEMRHPLSGQELLNESVGLLMELSADVRDKYKLDDLLAEVTDENKHEEMITDIQGRELL